MLDHFIELAYTADVEKRASVQTAAKLATFPTEVLRKLAAGELNDKLAFMDGPCSMKGDGSGPKSWLEGYRGTPLFDKALELERADLQLEQKDQARSQASSQESQQTWQARDAIRLQKRMLDLDLVLAEEGGEAAPADEDPAANASPEQKEEQGVSMLEQAQAEETAAGEGGEPHEQAEDAAIQQFRKAQAQEATAKAKTPPAVAGAQEEKGGAETKVATALAAGRLLAKVAYGEAAPTYGEHLKHGVGQSVKGSLIGGGAGAALGAAAGALTAPPGKRALRALHGAAALAPVGAAGGAAIGNDKAKFDTQQAFSSRKTAEASPEGHKLRRALLGNPISAAIEAKPGQRMEAYGQANGNLKGKTLGDAARGLGIGALGGALAGGLAGGLSGPTGGLKNALIGAGQGALLGGGAGGIAGLQVGQIRGHLGADASRIHGEHSKHAFALVPGALGAMSGYGKGAPEGKHKKASVGFITPVTKEAGIGSMLAGAVPAIAGAAKGAGSMLSTAYKAGGLGQVAKSVGTVAGGFAKANPLAAAGAAAGVAGGAGLLAGRLSKPSAPAQPRM